MTRVRIAPGVVEVEATGAKAEHLAEIAADLWDRTQTVPPRSNWLVYRSRWMGDEDGVLTTTNGGDA